MKLWICIPVHNRWHFTERCLQSLRQQDYSNYEILVCDDGSSDGTAKNILRDYPEVTLLRGNGDLWWTGAINLCVTHALNFGDPHADAVVTLNNDLEVEAGYLTALHAAARRHPDALLTSAGYDIETRKLVETGRRLSWVTSKSRLLDPMRDAHLADDDVAEVTHAPGRGTLVPLRVFTKIGLFDFSRLPHYGADYDLTFRARRAGYRVLICYSARVFSHVSATGLSGSPRRMGLRDLRRYLFDRKSPANISARWWFAYNNCPRFLLPSFLAIDLCFVLGGYVRYFLRSSSRDGRKDSE